MGRGRGRGRGQADALIGKSVRVIKGPSKGRIGIVKSASLGEVAVRIYY
jgi:transcription elongation factor